MHDDGSVESVIIEELDTSNPVASSMPEKVFAAIVGSFLATDAASSGRVGLALSYLLPAKELVSYAVSVLERDYGRSL
jgi:hypothetical protein